ncbi:MAG: helix-turn-helix transcriptional regulator [Ferruginibacter sp.]|nr:helix-turn-helix transcriptional regulator [Rhodoferax sp.]
MFTPLHGPEQGGFALAYNLPPILLERWANKSRQDDPYAHAIFTRGLFLDGATWSGEELVPHADLVRTAFYRDMFEPMDVARICAGVVFDAVDAHKVPTVISVYRHEREAPFGAAQVEVLRWSHTSALAVGGSVPKASVFIYDLAVVGKVPPTLLCKLFVLTATEARAALQMLQGGTTEEIALRLGISVCGGPTGPSEGTGLWQLLCDQCRQPAGHGDFPRGCQGGLCRRCGPVRSRQLCPHTVGSPRSVPDGGCGG